MSIPTSRQRKQWDASMFLKMGSTLLGLTGTVCLGLITYIYTTDRSETRELLREISKNVASIHDGQLINYSQIKNIDARLINTDEAVKELRVRAEVYWRKE